MPTSRLAFTLIVALCAPACASSQPAPEPRDPDAMVLKQGTNPRLGDAQVGVMNIFERDGVPSAQLSIHFEDDETEREPRWVKVGDVLTLGTETWVVTEVVADPPGEGRDYLVVAPK